MTATPATGAVAPPRAARSAAAGSERRWRPPVPRRPWRSVRVRITVVATSVFAVTVAAVALLLVNQVQRSLESTVQQQNDVAVQTITRSLAAGEPPPAAVASVESGVPVAVLSEDGRVLAGSVAGSTATGEPGVGAGPGSVSGSSEVAPLPAGPGLFIMTQNEGDTLVSRTAIQTAKGPVTIVAESPLATVQRSVDTISGLLLIGTPVLVAGFAVMVWVLVGRSLRPVEVMRAEVDEISHTTMHRRVHEPGTDDEVDRLAVTMNEMLDRLEAASDRQRQFVSDASHELKTPLATIRTNLEVALRNPDATDWPATARRVLDADRDLTELVTGLLDLARLDDAEAAALGPDAPAVDLEEVVMAVVGEPRGDDAVALPSIDVGGVVAGRVRGDRSDLERLVRNLVDNARRHGGGRVAVAVTTSATEPAWVTLTVGDDGPGIAPDDRQRVFDRFTRLDDARSTTGGTGLGLAIVRAIAERHGGSVTIGDSPLGGAELVVTLPAA